VSGDPFAGLTLGVLALQGAFREHRLALERLGVEVREVRLPKHLDGLDGLILPGGESTTMAKLMVAYEFDRALPEVYGNGMPVWGTCAGAILVAQTIAGHEEQPSLGLMPITVARNDYGRQVASFETDLDVSGLDAPFRAVFIRAPRIVGVADDVEVLAWHAGDPVAVRHDHALATVFHPELSNDDRLHAWFVSQLVARHPGMEHAP